MRAGVVMACAGIGIGMMMALVPAHAAEPNSEYVVPINRFAKVTPFLYRGARPTEDGIGVLRTLGVKTILNIDNEKAAIATERKWANQVEIQYISIPLSGFFAPTDQQMDRIFKVIHDPSNYPIFLHCKHGEDRTGLVVGLYRYNDEHWTAKDAYAEMLDRGFHKVLLGLNYYFKEKTGLIEAASPPREQIEAASPPRDYNNDLLLLGELQ